MATDTQVLESLAFLYLAFGHSTDGTLAPEEMRALAGKLREWAPNVELGDIGELLKSAVATYKATSNKLGKARELTTALRGKLDDAQLSKVLADLEAIAAADGNVSVEEQAFIEETRATLRG
ncbi:MAG: TerB family tellurite resistance protein [Enhygromyxa sp.]